MSLGIVTDRLHIMERDLKIMINSKLSMDFLPLWSRFWKFWANTLKSRLQLNHVPVHETQSAKVIKITTTSLTPHRTCAVS
jgi:hypothetical protein